MNDSEKLLINEVQRYFGILRDAGQVEQSLNFSEQLEATAKENRDLLWSQVFGRDKSKR